MPLRSLKCEKCGKPFETYAARGRFCSRSCFLKRQLAGSIWKNESNGYWYIQFGRKNKRLLHRYLTNAKPGQVVHHIDGNKENNSLSNLQILKGGQSEHIKMHNPVLARWAKRRAAASS